MKSFHWSIFLFLCIVLRKYSTPDPAGRPPRQRVVPTGRARPKTNGKRRHQYATCLWSWDVTPDMHYAPWRGPAEHCIAPFARGTQMGGRNRGRGAGQSRDPGGANAESGRVWGRVGSVGKAAWAGRRRRVGDASEGAVTKGRAWSHARAGDGGDEGSSFCHLGQATIMSL